MKNKIMGGIVGHVVGDALGVPVEFTSRAHCKANPVTGMRGYGTYNQPAGTWSDDSSMLFATMESLVLNKCFIRSDMMNRFYRWAMHGAYTPHGVAFDIGGTTRTAIARWAVGREECGLSDEKSNGNGSLMRILPFAIGLANGEIIWCASAMTHAHMRSIAACFLYSSIVQCVMADMPLADAIKLAMAKYAGAPEIEHYARLNNLQDLTEDEIRSSGYVVDTLEAALWCALTTDNYKDCVLKAVNLGEDTDTIGAIAGGLAGVMYGFDAIPAEWVNALQRKEYVLDMANKFAGWVYGHTGTAKGGI